jgi:predicted nucleic acid-binding Zn ribbon protein
MTTRKKDKAAKWELTRQRFHIMDPYPPSTHRKAREIGDILTDILSEERPEESIPQEIIEHWQLAAGKQIAQHTVPDAIRDGILTINVDHPGWLTEVRRLPKQPILKKLNAVPALPPLRDIRFRLDPSLRTKGRYT